MAIRENYFPPEWSLRGPLNSRDRYSPGISNRATKSERSRAGGATAWTRSRLEIAINPLKVQTFERATIYRVAD